MLVLDRQLLVRTPRERHRPRSAEAESPTDCRIRKRLGQAFAGDVDMDYFQTAGRNLTAAEAAGVRCYGASGDDIASIGGLLTERWLHRRRC